MTCPSPSPSPRGMFAGQESTNHPARVVLTVDGMHCGACVALIEESLADQRGVITASVDLESARAVVSYDSSLLGIDDLRSALEEAGYSATPVG